MDGFILMHYKAGHKHKRPGTGQRFKLAEKFAELFHIPTTPNMLIGRYHRIKHLRRPVSLPVLKFMQGADHA
jgi:hypothetical protein